MFSSSDFWSSLHINHERYRKTRPHRNVFAFFYFSIRGLCERFTFVWVRFLRALLPCKSNPKSEIEKLQQQQQQLPYTQHIRIEMNSLSCGALGL